MAATTTTCRELAKLDANSAELAAREKSHRDPLKQREKQLRNSTDVDELFQLLEDCEYELAEDDSLLKKARQLFVSKETLVLAHVNTRLETKKTQTCRFLQNLLNQVSRTSSGGGNSLTKRLKSLLEERMKTHRKPLELALQACEHLKDLSKLKQKMASELAPTDDLFTRLADMEQKRAHVRDQLTTKYKSLVSAKKWKLSQISSFLKEAMAELDEDDALVGQIKSLMENKMQQDQGLKPVREIERLPDEEVQVLSKRSGSSSSKKKSSSSAAATTSSSTRAPRDSNGGDGTSLFGNVQSLAKGLTSDLTGAPTQSSTLYKLGILICFLLYIAIVSYSASLTIKVAKVDLPDLSVASTQVLQKLRLRKAPPPMLLDADALAAVTAGGTGGGDGGDSAPPPEKEEEEEKGGGGDDDEED